MLNLPADNIQPVKTEMPEPVVFSPSSSSEEVSGSLNTAEKPTAARRRRKAIVKHIKLDKLLEPVAENPALKAVPAEERDRVYVRVSGTSSERQIVSVPLMLINEQLGAAVERFNCCACDECLRAITDSALDLMPPMYVRVINAADEDEVNRLIREQRPEAIRVLARLCISALSKPFHGRISDTTEE
ncbi:MAG: hypothetical protein FWH08_01975 [Oscillospiraceae bacterium]|nr:hypothetical protein [Oscillospiraceae bacterium]